MEVVTGATGSLVLKLGLLLQDEYNLRDKVRRDIGSLQNELLFINATLRMVEEVPSGQLDEHVRIWAAIIRELSYDMEGVVNTFVRSVHGGRRRLVGGVIDSMLCFCRKHHQIADTIKDIRSIIKEVSELRDRYRIDGIVAPPAQRGDNNALSGYLAAAAAEHVGERCGRYGVRDPGIGSSKKGDLDGYVAAQLQETTARALIGTKKFMGVEADLEELEKWITSSGDQRRSVLSICGLFGTGKTAAAMALYQRCRDQFDCRAMVSLHSTADYLGVLHSILLQVCPQILWREKSRAVPRTPLRMLSRFSRISQPCCRDPDRADSRTLDTEHIKDELMEHLAGRRYLLFIDNVWSASVCELILRCLPRDEAGSRIIVTTRFVAVAMTASLTDHDRFHHMNILSEVDAKKLFDKSLSESRGTEGSKVSQNDQVPPERVWKMCGGLRLPIVTMAGLVASQKHMNPEKWSTVCNTLFPEEQVCRRPEEFMRMIDYCYSVFPSDLKTCCLYLCIFPKGRSISKKRLTRRWIAEGFVSEKKGLSVDDVAEACFNQLIKMQIMQPAEHSTDGKVKSCRVHDLVLEYIISKADEENFVTVVGGQWFMPTRSNKVRRISLQSRGSKPGKEAEGMNLSDVRSLTLFWSLDQHWFKLFKTSRKTVEVLDLQGCNGFKASRFSISDFCEMTLLKYLNLRGTDISELPANIGDLKHLETLDIRQTGVVDLPTTVILLERISNILGGDKRRRKALKLPKEINKGAMRNLRVLSGIDISEGWFAVSNLHNLTGLRKLAIYKFQKSDRMFKDLLSSIEYLCQSSLKFLAIHDESSEFHHKMDNMLTPPVCLSALEMTGNLRDLPTWILNLKEIVKLTLAATVLGPEILERLRDLETLFSLTFLTCATENNPDNVILQENKANYQDEILVPAGGFVKLKLFRIFVPDLLPSLKFSEGAMPVLERLELGFGRLKGLHGMDNLDSLDEVILTVDWDTDNSTKSILNDLKAAKGNYVLDIKGNYSVMN